LSMIISGVAHWLNREKSLLCGYNCKHYDMYILKGILVGATPPEIKGISDFIIEEKGYGWEIDMGWVKMPNSIDLMLDLPTRPSLKQIEGNLLLDIRESSVAFDTETLTDEQVGRCHKLLLARRRGLSDPSTRQGRVTWTLRNC